MLKCNCKDFEKGYPQVIEAQVFCAQEGGPVSEGPIAKFCPWCGERLLTLAAPDPAVAAPDLKGIAMNIVNAILEEAGTDVETRQQINDDCDRFVIEMLETLNPLGG